MFEDGGRIVEHAGGYSDWARRGRALKEMDRPGARTRPADDGGRAHRPATRTKLGFREQQELEALPGRIEALEADVAELQGVVAAPGFYEQPYEDTRRRLDELEARTAELDAATERWLELEDLQETLRANRPGQKA